MNFEDAPMKREGEPVFDGVPPTTEVEVTYIERRVPRHLTHLVDKLIDKFLRERGYKPEEL
jgi:hypothetical protein